MGKVEKDPDGTIRVTLTPATEAADAEPEPPEADVTPAEEQSEGD